MVITAVDKFTKPLKKATAMVKKLGSVAAGIGKGLAKIAVGIAATVGAVSLVVSKYVSMLDKIGKTAEKLGIDPEFLQKLRFAAEQTGVKVEALDMGLQRFIRRTAEAAKGTGEAKKALSDLGIALFDQNNQLRNIEEVFFDVADAIANTTDSAEQVRLAFKFFDSEGVALVATLKEGSEGLRNFYQEAENLGIIISRDTIKKAEKFADAFNRIKKQMNAIVSGILGAFLPALEAVSGKFSTVLADARDVEGTFDTLGETIGNKLIEGLAKSVESFGVFLDFIEKALIKVEFFAKKAEIALTSLRPFKDLAQWREDFDAALATVGQFGDEAKETADKIRSFWEELKKSEEGTGKLKEKLKVITPLFPELAKSLEGFGIGFKKVFENNETTLLKFEKLGESVAKKLEDGLVDAFMNIRSGVEGLKDVMDQILKDIIAQLIRVHVVQKAVGAVTSFFGGGKASGGPVSAGRAYIVGEKGPELFVPGSSRGIDPHNQLATAGAGTNVNVTFDIKSWESRDTLQAISQQAPAIVGIVEQSFRKRGRRGPLGP